ncbi:MAG: hypothetical protein JXA60_03455 [Candidatus Coatesbacteria bacterium]|nr:hypothetical protein [Candidatus Coatesbacteria bacterium]
MNRLEVKNEMMQVIISIDKSLYNTFKYYSDFLEMDLDKFLTKVVEKTLFEFVIEIPAEPEVLEREKQKVKRNILQKITIDI